MNTAFFGECDVADGRIAMHDGGMHGVQGHSIEIGADGTASWHRRLDGMQPRGNPGSGSFAPTEMERADLERWAEAAWELAGAGRDRFYPTQPEPPRWVWCVLVRRGAEVRMVQGGGVTQGGEPAELAPALDWLRGRVDALSEAAG
jgi:hypothetical protein